MNARRTFVPAIPGVAPSLLATLALLVAPAAPQAQQTTVLTEDLCASCSIELTPDVVLGADGESVIGLALDIARLSDGRFVMAFDDVMYDLPPMTAVNWMNVDEAGRLWVYIQRPTPGWRDHVESTGLPGARGFLGLWTRSDRVGDRSRGYGSGQGDRVAGCGRATGTACAVLRPRLAGRLRRGGHRPEVPDVPSAAGWATGRPTAGRSADASRGRAGIDGGIRRVTTHEASAVTQIPIRVNDAVAELILGRAHVHEVIERSSIITRDGAIIFMKGIRRLSSPARHEIPDAVLGPDPRVQVLMGLEDDVHPVLAQDRLEFGGQRLILAAAAETEPLTSLWCVDRMVHRDDLPARVGTLQSLGQPTELSLIGSLRELRLLAAERVGVEHEHLCEGRLPRLRKFLTTAPVSGPIGKLCRDLDRVVAEAVEIAEFGCRQVGFHFAPGRQFVGEFIPGNGPQLRLLAVLHVVVAKRRVNPHSKGKDVSVDIEELAADGLRVAVFVDVVPQHEDVRNGHGLGLAADLRRDLPGAVIAGTGVSDEDEPGCSCRILELRAEGRAARRAGQDPDAGTARASHDGDHQDGPGNSDSATSP